MELGDIVALDGQLHGEPLAVFVDLRQGFLLPAGGEEDRAAIDALDRLFHPLGGQHAAVVLAEDGRRLFAERETE